MKLTHITLIAASAVLLMTGCTPQPNHQGGQKEGKKHMPKDPKAKAAMQECKESLSKDTNTRPNKEAMKACMKAKGFERPVKK